MQERTALANIPSVTLDADREQSRPAEGEIDWVKSTLPLKPFAPFTIMVDVAVESALVLTEAGLAVTAKSGRV